MALGLARDLLSLAMRIRELRTGNKPYRWVMECYDSTGWRGEQEIGFLDRNHLGRASERTRVNDSMPSGVRPAAPGGS